MSDQALSQDIIDRYSRLSTSCISDAMDKKGVECAFEGIKCRTKSERLCGQAFTVHYVPCGKVKGTVGDFLDDVKPGQVIVIDNGGRVSCTVWGGIMSHVARQKNISGTLIDGVCRDITEINKSGYTVFSRDVYMRTGKDRVEVDYTNQPVSICGVQVRPGDLIIGDENGAVRVPADMAEEVLFIAEHIDDTENHIVLSTVNGMPLKEARAKYGYHKLQTKEI